MSALRERVRDYLRAARVPEAVLEELVLVVDEIASNSVEHGAKFRRSGDRMELQVHVMPDRVDLRFVDRDVPSSEVRELAEMCSGGDGSGPPPFDFERGRGMYLIATGLDTVSVRPLDDRTGDGMVLEGARNF